MKKQLVYLLGFGMILSYLIVSFSRNFMNWLRVGNQLDSMSIQVKELGHERLDLERTLDYSKTHNYVEEEARERLNMGREGETVLLLPTVLPKTVEDKE